MLGASNCCGEQSKGGIGCWGMRERELRFEIVWSGKVSPRVTSKVGARTAMQVPGAGGGNHLLAYSWRPE